MNQAEQTPRPVQGAADLAAMWSDLPYGMALLEMPAAATHARVVEALADLKMCALGERCAHGVDSCADLRKVCQHAEQCQAQRLYPGWSGGAPQWQMAALTARWLPEEGQLQLLAWGDVGRPELGWAARRLRSRMGWRVLAEEQGRWGQRWWRQPGAYHLQFLTPPMLTKAGPGQTGGADPGGSNLQATVMATLSARALKLTALALDGHTRTQRLAGHLSRHVTAAVLGTGLQVLQADLRFVELDVDSRSSHEQAERRGTRASRFRATSCEGHAVLGVSPEALPWLSMLSEFGLGENTDEGFGMVEVHAM